MLRVDHLIYVGLYLNNFFNSKKKKKIREGEQASHRLPVLKCNTGYSFAKF